MFKSFAWEPSSVKLLLAYVTDVFTKSVLLFHNNSASSEYQKKLKLLFGSIIVMPLLEFIQLQFRFVMYDHMNFGQVVNLPKSESHDCQS